MRIEKDSMGEKQIPEDAWYGIHTSRSMENFNVAGEVLPLEIIYAIVRLKAACATANQRLGLLDQDRSRAIRRACDAILLGMHDDQFPIDIFQAGSGTSSQMNVNEVIANLAVVELGGKPGDRQTVHPNDHVNKGQSTNNVFPSAIRVACLLLTQRLDAALDRTIASLGGKAHEFAHVPKSGRTHLQDAVPITLGQTFSGYARALEKAKRRITAAGASLLEIGIGGNAVGTGINTKPAFRSHIVAALSDATGLPFEVPGNGVEITQFMTDMGQVSAALKLLSLDLLKIANDLRLLSSGPNTGIGEIRLPAVEPGSSIMPGKVNPSICEAANMACIQVVGYDSGVAMACGLGQLELNTHMPLIGANLVKSFNILIRTCTMLDERCIRGIEADETRCRKNFEASAGLATILNPTLGYDRVAALVKEGLAGGKSLKALVLEKKLMSEQDLERLLAGAFGPVP
ncbi:aspartate ammonia-lyase [Desulfosarcina alkanivorans]|uniref:Aspartate ammonia-lyase n=1 Tax=Desulfosarcina alkanivorans TaxID=571177 RepID=A0A5K7YFF5_9BACT|nr:aspartate ammonia-lyase [Desulfosarcina alkanivorans]BBO66489.1 aspartate ammonia-lyase [Desulfosarcina alkanivorans]